MTLEQQQKVFQDFIKSAEETLFRKGNDYAGEDRLSNFKLAGSICGLSPEQNCLSLIATKVARLGQLLQGKTPSNESIDDSILDLANYAILLKMLVVERAQPTLFCATVKERAVDSDSCTGTKPLDLNEHSTGDFNIYGPLPS